MSELIRSHLICKIQLIMLRCRWQKVSTDSTQISRRKHSSCWPGLDHLKSTEKRLTIDKWLDGRGPAPSLMTHSQNASEGTTSVGLRARRKDVEVAAEEWEEKSEFITFVLVGWLRSDKPSAKLCKVLKVSVSIISLALQICQFVNVVFDVKLFILLWWIRCCYCYCFWWWWWFCSRRSFVHLNSHSHTEWLPKIYF